MLYEKKDILYITQLIFNYLKDSQNGYGLTKICSDIAINILNN